MRLTEKQRETVEKNHNLIWDFINKNKLEDAEYYDFFAIVLCEAVMTHNPKKGRLSTHWWHCATNAYRNHLRDSGKKLKKNDHNGIMSLDEVEETLEGNPDMYFDNIEFLLSQCKNEFTEKILKLMYCGYNQTEIANKLGVTQSYISLLLAEYKKEFKDD